jgi:hypothetical protein
LRNVSEEHGSSEVTAVVEEVEAVTVLEGFFLLSPAVSFSLAGKNESILAQSVTSSSNLLALTPKLVMGSALIHVFHNYS